MILTPAGVERALVSLAAKYSRHALGASESEIKVQEMGIDLIRSLEQLLSTASWPVSVASDMHRVKLSSAASISLLCREAAPQ